jgi:predicted TIM-barrel fold metal-dependent hydrolase
MVLTSIFRFIAKSHPPMKRYRHWYILALLLIPGSASSGGLGSGPVLDMHLHAGTADQNGPPGQFICVPMLAWLPTPDPARTWPEQFMEAMMNPPCDDPIPGSMTDDELMQASIEELVRSNAVGVLSGPPERVRQWVAAAPERFIPSLQLNLQRDPYDANAARALLSDGGFMVLGEVSNQYVGIGPDDPRMMPFWDLAAELDIPVAIHMGTGPPGTAALSPGYLVSKGNPLLLEPVLARHPTLRVSIMHMAQGFEDELRMILYSYPNVYVDIGALMWLHTERDFERMLGALVDAGWGGRIMHGSDQMNWPGLISRSIEIIRNSAYLSDEQKEAILFSNAVRFLKLDPQEIRRRAMGKP